MCINENETYLKTIIHEVGMRLHSTATCTQLSCVQDGIFSLDDALLPKHWTLKDIMASMKICHRLIKENDQLLGPESAALEFPEDTREIPTEEQSTA